MRIDQFVPGFAKHDAISNHVLQVRRVLRQAGHQSDIYGEAIDSRLSTEARSYRECASRPDPERVLLYHSSTNSSMVSWLEDVAGAGQMVGVDYHNVTPSRYFARWEPQAARSMQLARDELARMAGFVRFSMADSGYNEAELIELGYRETRVCPLLIDWDDYHREPDGRTVARLNRRRARGAHQWLFVGRTAPNKCQHDVIAAFAIYRRLFDRHARLALVGGATSPRYLAALRQMAGSLELGDSIEFRETVAFPELLAYFHASDVFVCLSEHEGFCVPIIEAMELGLPVVAYGAAAVTETVASAGVLLDDKDPVGVACSVDALLSDPTRRDALIESGRARAGDFALETTSKHFLETLDGWLARPST